METQKAKQVWKIRDVTAMVVIPAFAIALIADVYISEMNPFGRGPWPETLSRPTSLEILLMVRNISFLVALITGLFSLPRWQAILGLFLTIGYFAFSYVMFAMY
jgi:hypothetical protein